MRNMMISRFAGAKRVTLTSAMLGSLLSAILLLSTPKKHRWSLLRLFWRSLYLSVWSVNLRNMLMSSLILSYVLARRSRVSVAVPLSFVSTYVLWYHFAVNKYAQVQSQATYWNTLIIEKARLAQRPFCPTIWGINRHSQTCSCTVFSMIEWLWSKPVTYIREEVKGWDGNYQHLDWVGEVLSSASDGSALPKGQNSPICILLHGLGDDRFHPYIMRFARLCQNRGWRAVAFSYWRFDFSESRDLEGILDHISKKAPHAPLIAIGWSAGGHLLLNYLGAVGKATPLVCAVALSPATDFGQHGKVLVEDENVLYYKFMGMQAQKCLRRHVRNDKRIKNTQSFLKRFSMFDLDAVGLYDSFLMSSPSDSALSGSTASTSKTFSTRRRNSLGESFSATNRRTGLFKNYPKAAEVVAKINIPLLFVYSEDDPVTLPDKSVLAELDQNRHVIVMKSERGGHCGFYEGFLPFGPTWDARIASDYVSAVLEMLSHTNYMLNVIKEAVRQGQLAEIPAPTAAPNAPAPSNAFAASTLQALGPVMMRRISSDVDVRV